MNPLNASIPQQAIILAAGLGTRLRPLTHAIPKPALPVGGVPIIFFNLILLKNAGIKNISINLHHQPNILKRLLKLSQAWGLNLQFSVEHKILGTAGGIAHALTKMKRTTTLVINGDILMDLDIRQLIQIHRRSKALATLACVDKDRANVKSFVEYDRQGRIWRIAGGPPLPNPLPRGEREQGIFTGAQVLEPRLFDSYPRDSFGCVVRQIYQPALAKGFRLQAYFHQGAWWDLGDLKELKRVDQSLWKGEAPKNILKLWEQAKTIASKSKS